MKTHAARLAIGWFVWTIGAAASDAQTTTVTATGDGAATIVTVGTQGPAGASIPSGGTEGSAVCKSGTGLGWCSTIRLRTTGEVQFGAGALPGAQGGGTYSGSGHNIAIGTSACAANTTGACTAVGYQAGMSNGAGNDGVITAFGWQALKANTTGHATAFGWAALRNNTESHSAAFGDEAGGSNTTGTVACLGYYACNANTTGKMTAVGYQAGRASTSDNSTYVGYNAGYYFTGGSQTAVGHSALSGANGTASGSANTAVGYQALYSVTSGVGSVAVGANAGFSATSGWLTAVGYGAAQYMTTGYITAIGWRAGYGVTSANAPVTDTKGILIGEEANRSVVSATKLDNYIGIGWRTLVDKSNQVKIGNDNITETVLYGNLILKDTGSKPACDATTRGSFWYDAGGAGVADTLEACRKDAADAYAWVSVY